MKFIRIPLGVIMKTFYYKDGSIYWKIKRGSRKADNLAGITITISKYSAVKCYGTTYLVHRIIWEMFNGKIPKNMQIDHIDNNRLNNRIENLRLANKKQNSWNALPHKRKTKTSKYKGVSLHKNNIYKAYIQDENLGKRINLGLFETEILAANAYDKEAIKRFGKYARTNKDIFPKDFNKDQIK